MSQTPHSYRAPAVIGLLGMLVALLPLPMVSRVNSTSTLLENLDHVVVLIRPAETSPFFDGVPPGTEDSTAQLIAFPHSSGSELQIEFPRGMTIDEMTAVMRAGAKDGAALQKNPPKAKRLRFREWVTDRSAIEAPYRYFLFCGLLLLFSAAFVALFSRSQGSSGSDRAA
jgi:hypothetical protein